MMVIELVYIAVGTWFLVDDLRVIRNLERARPGFRVEWYEPVICAGLWPLLIYIGIREGYYR